MSDSDSSDDAAFWGKAVSDIAKPAPRRPASLVQERAKRPGPQKEKHKIQKLKRHLQRKELDASALSQRHEVACAAAYASTVRAVDRFTLTADGSNAAESRHWTPEGILAVAFIFDSLTNAMLKTLFGIVSTSARAALITVANLCLRLTLKAVTDVLAGAPKVLVVKRMWDETRHKLRAEACMSNPVLKKILKCIPALPTTSSGKLRKQLKKRNGKPARRAARSALGRTSSKVRNNMVKFANRKVNVTMSVMAQRLWLRWGPAVTDVAACLLPPYGIESTTATNMLNVFDSTTAPLSTAALHQALKQPNKPWLLYVLLSDRAKSNRRLAMHLEAEFKDDATAFIIDTRCDAHQAAKIAEYVLQECDVLNHMFAAGHLMMLSCTIGPLLEALNFLLDTPGYVRIFHCIPPLRENLDYSTVVLQHTLLHSVQKVFNLHGGYTALPESILLACQNCRELSCHPCTVLVCLAC